MSSALRQAFIAVGANLGDRAVTIRAAVAALRAAPGIFVVESSAIYETAPVGLADQPPFLNLVLGIRTTLSPEALLALLRFLELASGRTRESEVRWGPRPLDLDLLLFEGEARSSADLTLPHPRMWERSFVTIPLADLLARFPKFALPPALREKLPPPGPPAAGVALWTPPV